MIYVLFGENTRVTNTNPGEYFNHVYDIDWFNDMLVQKIVSVIDSSEVVGGCIKGPLGLIPYTQLSTTAKTLILLLKDDNSRFEPNAYSIGDNGFELFAEIGRQRDIYIASTSFYFTMEGCDDFDFCCVNDMSYGHGEMDWRRKLAKFGRVGSHKEPGIESIRGYVR